MLGGSYPNFRGLCVDDFGIPACSPFPLISVLIAVRNEGASIGACLACLARQDYPAALIEVIIADGCSEDATPAIVRRFAGAAPFHVELLTNEKCSSAAGFNAALRASRGDVIVILGARARPEPAFLRESVAALRESGAAAAGGLVRGLAGGFQGQVNALALRSPFGAGGARYRHGGQPGETDTVNYGAYRRAVFARIGGFDETMTNVEDDEFNYRLRARGGRLFFSPEIRCGYLVRPTLAGLARQFTRYGYPKIRVLRRHPRQMQPRQFGPAGFVLMLCCGLAAAPFRRPARALLVLSAFTYGAASLIASLAVARRRGWHFLPLLPVAFAGMHLGYGAASLAGSMRFLLWPALLGRREPAEVPSFDSDWLEARQCEQT